MQNLLAIIENRIRNEPQMLFKAKELFCKNNILLKNFNNNTPYQMHSPSTIE